MKSFGYTVLKGENEKPILCEKILFSDLQSFLFYDFFNGIRNNYIPNRCKHCGKFFLIRGGKYFSYCDNPLKDAPDKPAEMSAQGDAMTTNARTIQSGRPTIEHTRHTMHAI